MLGGHHVKPCVDLRANAFGKLAVIVAHHAVLLTGRNVFFVFAAYCAGLGIFSVGSGSLIFPFSIFVPLGRWVFMPVIVSSSRIAG
jgi:hypothetical protein